MNKRLDSAIDAARGALSDDDQDDLAAIVEEFVSCRSVDPAQLLTPEQLADLDRRLAEPFEPADPARVRAIFERHGISVDF